MGASLILSVTSFVGHSWRHAFAETQFRFCFFIYMYCVAHCFEKPVITMMGRSKKCYPMINSRRPKKPLELLFNVSCIGLFFPCAVFRRVRSAFLRFEACLFLLHSFQFTVATFYEIYFSYSGNHHHHISLWQYAVHLIHRVISFTGGGLGIKAVRGTS